MFDTACTEALWEAVTGEAPDPRRGAEFPVTNVSWKDAQSFVRQLNAAKPGLDLSLPSEAQWEYACRAGTDTPYNFGTKISRELVCYESGAPVAGRQPAAERLGVVRDARQCLASGVPTTGTAATTVLRRTGRPGATLGRGRRPASFAAGLGTTSRATCVPRPAAATPRRTAMTTSAFAAPEFR